MYRVLMGITVYKYTYKDESSVFDDYIASWNIQSVFRIQKKKTELHPNERSFTVKHLLCSIFSTISLRLTLPVFIHFARFCNTIRSMPHRRRNIRRIIRCTMRQGLRNQKRRRCCLLHSSRGSEYL